jgi:hypothetical protein
MGYKCSRTKYIYVIFSLKKLNLFLIKIKIFLNENSFSTINTSTFLNIINKNII